MYQPDFMITGCLYVYRTQHILKNIAERKTLDTIYIYFHIEIKSYGATIWLACVKPAKLKTNVYVFKNKKAPFEKVEILLKKFCVK